MDQPNTLQFELVKNVTLPQLKWVVDQPFYIRFDGAIFESEKTTVTRARRPKLDEKGKPIVAAETNKKAPPMLAAVTDLPTGKQFQMIMNTVLDSTLQEKYPSDSYVGKCFKIIMHQLAGKDYKTFEIAEIRVKGTAPAPAPVATSTKKK